MKYMTCCECFIEFGVPDAMDSKARELGNFKLLFYCPAGHKQGFGESQMDRERRARQRAEQENARLAQEVARHEEILKAARFDLAAERKKAARMAKRAAAGVCPCCNRTVSQMARHMKTKHPDFNVVPLKAARAQR